MMKKIKYNFAGEKMNLLKNLIMTAKGERKAELVLKNAEVFHVFTGEFIKGDIAIVEGRIAGIGNYEGEQEIDLRGKYVTPGFIDGHIHLESSMLSPLEFARAVVPAGTTTVIADPHEIANVMGMAGVRYLLDATEDLPLNVYMMLPSCVPATHLENSGAKLLAADLAELIDHPRILGLGEMMNYPGVLSADPMVLDKIRLAKHKKIDGHAPGLSGNDLMAYAAAGVQSDHECVTPQQAMEKLRAGMYIMIREGSAAKNLRPLLPMINAYTSQFCCFAADDRHPADLISEGHINHMVKVAVEDVFRLRRHCRWQQSIQPGIFIWKILGRLHPNIRQIFSSLMVWKNGNHAWSLKTVLWSQKIKKRYLILWQKSLWILNAPCIWHQSIRLN